MVNRLKFRIDRIEGKANPTKYAQIEDLLRIAHREREPELTEAEQAQLDELRKMPIEPGFEKTLRELQSQYTLAE